MHCNFQHPPGSGRLRSFIASESKENKVAAGDIVPVSGGRFEDTLASASPDLLREMIKGLAQQLMDA